MMQIKLHPGKNRLGAQESHPTRGCCALRPVCPSLLPFPSLTCGSTLTSLPQPLHTSSPLGPQPTPPRPWGLSPLPHTRRLSGPGSPAPEGHAEAPKTYTTGSARWRRRERGRRGARLPAAARQGAGRPPCSTRSAEPRVRLFFREAIPAREMCE